MGRFFVCFQNPHVVWARSVCSNISVLTPGETSASLVAPTMRGLKCYDFEPAPEVRLLLVFQNIARLAVQRFADGRQR